MNGSFATKRLRFTFTLTGNAVFEDSGSNVLTIEGFRATAALKSAGAAIAPSAMLQIFGMKQSDMNALTFLAFDPRGLQKNTVKVETNSGDGWNTAFVGQIVESGPEYSAQPDVYLRIEALAGYLEMITPAPAVSVQGDVLINDIVKRLADAYGLAFEPNDVTGTISNPYYPQSLGEQLRKFCEDANVDLYRDGEVIAIQVRGKPRRTPRVNLTPSTGLIGYPSIDRRGIQVRCLYNSGLRFGGTVHVESDLNGILDKLFPAKANGDWWIYSLEHYLQSETPGGQWESLLGCSDFGETVVR